MKKIVPYLLLTSFAILFQVLIDNVYILSEDTNQVVTIIEGSNSEVEKSQTSRETSQEVPATLRRTTETLEKNLSEESTSQGESSEISSYSETTQIENKSRIVDEEKNTTEEPVAKRSIEQASTGQITISNLNPSTGTFDVVIRDVSSSLPIQSVKVPVWTSAGGQDDLIWYTASKQSDGTYQLTINKKNHKNEFGEYIIHLYYDFSDGSSKGIAGTQTVLQQTVSGQITVHNLNPSTGTFDVEIRDVSSSLPIQSVKVPVWTSVGGQDDLIWYTASKQSDGTYQLTINKKNHKNEFGEYIIHLYYDFSDGSSKGITGTQTVLQQTVSGQITVHNLSPSTGTFDVEIRDVSSSLPIQSVKVPVWTSAGGQDDLIWYTASKQSDGTYQLTINKKNHQNSSGEYNIHLYYELKDGGIYGVSSQKTVLSSKVEGKIELENLNKNLGTFDIRISNVSSPDGIQTVLVPVWSDQGGQDDLRWYEARQDSSGNYKLKIEAKNHNYSKGLYHIHLYYKAPNQNLLFVKALDQNIEVNQKQAQAKLTIQNVNQSNGTFDAVVSEVFAPLGFKDILIPVWSDKNGQDDIRWYTAARQANGTYQVSISISNHGYQTGLYHIHAYYNLNNNQKIGIGSQETQVSYEGLRFNGNVYQVNGKYGPVPIINKKYPLNASYNPGENPVAKAAFDRLTNQMRALGFGISYNYSGFRSYQTQNYLYWNYVNQYGQVAADRFSARAGYSEHQTGLAFDVMGTGNGLLSQPNAVAWLAQNAHKYGFIIRYPEGKEAITGYMAEAWHIRYIGAEAEDIYRSGLTLEEYFKVPGGGY